MADIRGKNPLVELLKLTPYLREYKLKLIIIVGGSVLFALIRLIDPFIYKIITDQVLVKAYSNGINLTDAVRITLWSCGLTFFFTRSTGVVFADYSSGSMDTANRM